MSSCQQCGACCACFRVDFAVEELDSNGGPVPTGLADALNGHLARMRGTDHAKPRCAALSGKLGAQVACGIYEWRPGPCREFEESSSACNQARARHGLPAI